MSERRRPAAIPARACLTGAAVVAGLLLAASPALARPSADGPWTVKDLGSGRGVFAGHVVPHGTQTFASLVRDWGEPASVRLRRYDCVVRWTRPSAQAVLRSYGLPPGATYCSRRYGLISTIKTIGTRWRTDRGLRVGDRETRITELYPDAFQWSKSPLSFGLRPYDTMGIEGAVTVAGAYTVVVGGQVRSFYAPVGGEGE